LKLNTVISGDGLKLNVAECGNKEGPAILFIHGWSQSYLCWMKQLESELAESCRLVAFDLRGHGSSEAPSEESNYTDSSDWASDVNSVIETLGLGKTLLVGWSYGGLVICDYVRHYGYGSVSGVNFVGAAVKLNEAAIGPLIGPGFYENFEAAVSNNLEASVDAMRAFVEGCFTKKLSREDYERILCFNMAVRPDVRASLSARDLDNIDVLKDMSVPVLVTQGTLDTVVLPSMALCILDNCNAAQGSFYDGVGHGPFIEAVDRFNAELSTFASSVR
jgi:non-heme chloroperoxidase